MNKYIILYLKEKKYYDYFKENSFFIKNVNRTNNIKEFENYIKDKYHLRTVDKVSNVIDSIDVLSSVLSQVK